MTSHELAEELIKFFELPSLAMLTLHPTNSHSQLLPIANRPLCNIYRRVVRPTTGDGDWIYNVCITRSRRCNSDNGIGQGGVVPCCTSWPADGMTSAVGKRKGNHENMELLVRTNLSYWHPRKTHHLVKESSTRVLIPSSRQKSWESHQAAAFPVSIWLT